MRKIALLHRQDGVALVLALMAISFLVAITVQLASSVNFQMQGANNIGNSIQLDAINRSGLNLIRAALAVDFADNQHDSIHDSWGKLGAEDAPTIFGQGTLDIGITDLSGLLQVNALVPDIDPKKDKNKFTTQQNAQIELWKRFLTSGKFDVEDDDQAGEIIDALIDWIDEDDEERDHGAESGYYLSQSPSYEVRNAPITYLNELLLIRGMTKELFYGNKEYLALRDYLTVAGRGGKININSAPVELLMALDENLSEETGQELEEFRQDEDNRDVLAELQWYKRVNSSINFFAADLITVQSSYFKVSVVAKHNEWIRTSEGILERDPDKGTQKLAYWEVR